MPEDYPQTDLRRRLNAFRLRDPAGRRCSLSQMATQIAERTGAESCSVFLTNSPDELVLAATTHGPLSEWIGRAAYRQGEGLTGWVFKHRRELRLRNIGDAAELAHYPGLMWMDKFVDSTRHRAWAAAPVFVASQVLGVVRISPKRSDFSDAEMDSLRFSCRHMAAEIIHAGGLPIRGWSTEELYRPAEVRIEVLRKVNDRLLAQLAEHPEDIHKLHHRMFEELIAELLAAEGWRTELTLPTHDGGYDIRAVRADENMGEVLLLVEAKRFRPDRPVGVDIVRDLYAVKQIKHATKAMLATTSYISRDAKEAFRDFMFELDFREYQDIVSWLRKYYSRDS